MRTIFVNVHAKAFRLCVSGGFCLQRTNTSPSLKHEINLCRPPVRGPIATFNSTRNQLLHLVYKALEDKFDVSLDEARLVTMERYGLPDCTTLEAVFRSDEYRDWFERVIDANLDPELRGW